MDNIVRTSYLHIQCIWIRGLYAVMPVCTWDAIRKSALAKTQGARSNMAINFSLPSMVSIFLTQDTNTSLGQLGQCLRSGHATYAGCELWMRLGGILTTCALCILIF